MKLVDHQVQEELAHRFLSGLIGLTARWQREARADQGYLAQLNGLAIDVCGFLEGDGSPESGYKIAPDPFPSCDITEGMRERMTALLHAHGDSPQSKRRRSRRDRCQLEFIEHVRDMAQYWTDMAPAGLSLRERLEGLAFSVCAGLDGVAGGLPGYRVVPRTTANVGPSRSGGKRYTVVLPTSEQRVDVDAATDAEITGIEPAWLDRLKAMRPGGTNQFNGHVVTCTKDEPVVELRGSRALSISIGDGRLHDRLGDLLRGRRLARTADVQE